MPKKDFTRREFMKVGVSCLMGAAASTGPLQGRSQQHQASAVSRTSLKELKAIPTTCQQCPAGCGVIAYLDGDRLVQILGNPKHPNNEGRICAKGIAGINLVNDPERLLFPMKRSGPRGKGDWIRISWDEAFHTLSKRISRLIAEDKIGELIVDRGKKDIMLDRFLSVAGIDAIIDRPSLKNWNRNMAMIAAVGSPHVIEDVENSRTILNFGANPYANHDHFIPLAQRLVRARTERGARLITFDVRMSETAAKSDNWYPLKAGTDGVLALAMVKVILDRNLADKDFLKARTNTTLDQLRQHLAPYTLEEAEKISDLKTSEIESVALEFASQKPSLAMIGGGVTDHSNGIQNARCVSLLNWVSGNLGTKGGLLYPPPFSGLDSVELSEHLSESRVDSNLRLKDMLEGNHPIDTYFAWKANPAYSNPDCQDTEEWLKDKAAVPFMVVMDTHMTETAMLADLVLPAATDLESWGIEAGLPLNGYPVLNLKQPVVSLQSPAKVLRSPHFDVGKLLEPVFQPKGEAMEIGNLCLEMARRTGGDLRLKLPFVDTQDFVRQTLLSIPGLDNNRFYELIKNQGYLVRKEDVQTEPLKKPGSLISVVVDTDEKSGQTPLPEYLPLPFHQKMQPDEFILTTFKSNLWSSGIANSKWAQEIAHENRIWINSGIAHKMGIHNGDRVRVSSASGNLVIRVLTTGRIHPKSVAIAEGHGHTAMGNIAQAKPFKSKDLDTRLLWWSKEGNGVNPMIVTRREPHLSGGYHAFKDTVIKIEKL